MSCGKAQLLLVINLAAIVVARPQDLDKMVQEASGGLPFLQFKDGGIRVNFAGYHAEAGLGGLLSGSGTGGGLHASAGTPSGTFAAAGLGGLLNGDNANAGGGLYARAGVGNGGPQAGAGLGGALDGSSRSGAEGGLFASASPGNLSLRKRKIGRTNVQVIPRDQPEASTVQKEKDVSAQSSAVAAASRSTDAAKDVEKEGEVEELVAPHSVGAGLFGGIYGGSGGSPARKTIEKVKISNGKVDVVEGTVGAQPTLETTGGVAAGGTPEIRPTGGRWYWRKRFRLAPARKNVVYQFQSEPNAQAAAAGSVNVVERSPDDVADVTFVADGNKSRSFFDDIFNIPISTLSAVNQLLRNNVG